MKGVSGKERESEGSTTEGRRVGGVKERERECGRRVRKEKEKVRGRRGKGNKNCGWLHKKKGENKEKRQEY